MQMYLRNPALRKAALSVALLSALPLAAQAQQNDPLYRYQWHLMNYGQSVLGDSKPAFGVDLGIDDLHTYNIRGKNVVVGVVDEGLQIAHPDLAANVVPDGSRNFNTGGPIHDPSPTQAGEGHGTAVGGIIAAVGWNGIGVRGVAPSAKLKGFNFLSPRAGGNQNDNIVYSWWNGAESKDVAVSNNSWGAAPLNPIAFSENEVAAFENPMAATRGGLGTVYVKAAGNHYNSHPVFFGLFNACTAETRAANVGCTQAGFDPRNNLFNVMTIAAVNAAGKRSNYSSPGTALWVSGLGGEYGHQKPYSTAVNPLNFDPAIVTTDVSGCTNGYNNDAADARLNALDSSQSAIDNSCNYTGRMNGTSAATPTVAGVAALMLQANPKLSYRDVRYLLATTARKIDPQQPAISHANGTLIAPGWTTNAAGRAYSTWYGYGLVDATLAVERSMAFKPLPALIDSGWQRAQVAAPVAIGNPAAPARLQVRIDRRIGKVEGVQLGLETNYALTAGFFSTAPSPLTVILTSPSGTKSYVVPAMTGLGATTAFTIPFIASNAFLDENGEGTWTLEVADVPLAAGAASKGNLTGFKIRVLGH
ncbi:S8 family serine peptidase [Pseudomonas sp. CGJS7]|uniref:S8 family serine peptidase n=1 Tax=Pseudomonas sp. CGJS7 TaxID=3109348 RepID=UPI00300AB8ED